MKHSIRKFISITSIVLFIFLAGLKSDPSLQTEKYAPDNPDISKWYRGNTHTHAQFSDKNEVNDVPAIAAWYKEAGYNFLLLSEHNDNVVAKQIFCHEEAQDLPDFIMLCGLELSKKRHHTALGIDSFISDESSLQDGVNKTIIAGGIPILNHPQDPVVTAKNIIDTKGLNHFEVFNGKRPGDTPANEVLWDSVLSSSPGREVYVVASDDNHYKNADVGKGWIMVRSPTLSKENILDNIKNGNFYASTGIILNDYKVNRKSVLVDSENGTIIKFIGRNGVELRTVRGTKATYKIKGNETYIRVKIINDAGKMAWTQPVFVK